MTTKETIKAEIERLKGQLVRGACAAQIEMETNCKEEAYNEILSFIDSLPDEQDEHSPKGFRRQKTAYINGKGVETR